MWKNENQQTFTNYDSNEQQQLSPYQTSQQPLPDQAQYFYPIQNQLDHNKLLNADEMMKIMGEPTTTHTKTNYIATKAKTAENAKKMRAKKDVRMHFLEDRVSALESENGDLKKNYDHRVKENDLLQTQLMDMRTKLSGLEDRLMSAIEVQYEDEQ